MAGYDPETGLPDFASLTADEVAEMLYSPRRSLLREEAARQGRSAPVRPSPLIPEESPYKRALSGVFTFLGTPARGVSTSVSALRGAVEGDPLKYLRLNEAGRESGVLGDVGGALGLTTPGYDQQAASSVAAGGLTSLAAAAAGGEFGGERLGLGHEGVGLADLTPEERQTWEERNPGKAYAKAVAGPVADLSLGAALDPTMAVLMGGPAAAGALGRALTPAAAAVAPAFIPALATGAVENLHGAYETYKREGFTPLAARQTTEGALEGVMALAGAAHIASRFKPKPVTQVEGEVMPDRALPPGPEPGGGPTGRWVYHDGRLYLDGMEQVGGLGAEPGYPGGPPLDAEVLDRQTMLPAPEDLRAAAGAQPAPVATEPRALPPAPQEAYAAALAPEALQEGGAGGAQLEARDLAVPAPEALPGENASETPASAAPPQTFREFVESRGQTWPMTARSPRYKQLFLEFQDQQAAREASPAPEEIRQEPAPLVGTAEAAPVVERAPERRREAQQTPVERRLAQRRAQLEQESPHYPADAREAIAQADVARLRHRLTGLPERELFDEAVAEKRYGGFASADGRQFGILNKTHGHEAGDAIIKALAEELAPVAKEHGVDLFHTGGDEFRLGGRDLAHVRGAGEAMQEALRGAVFTHTAADGTVRRIPLPEVDFGYGTKFGDADAELGAIKLARKSARPGEVAAEPPAREAGLAPSERPSRTPEVVEPRGYSLSPKEYRALKTALTRAVNTKDPAKILAESKRALDRFEDVGFPDDWHRWKVAREDAEYALQRAEPAQIGRPLSEKKPVTPQVPAPAGTRYVLPSFVTAGHGPSPLPERVQAYIDSLGFPEKSKIRSYLQGFARWSGSEVGSGRAPSPPPELTGQERIGLKVAEAEIARLGVGAADAAALREQANVSRPLDFSTYETFSQDPSVQAWSRLQLEMGHPTDEVIEALRQSFAREIDPRKSDDLISLGDHMDATDELETAAAEVEPNPTPGQMEAGNYKKGHVEWNGLDITIETAKGGERVAKDGSWRVASMPVHYGYVKGTEGADGEHVDVFLNDPPATNGNVFLIDQINPKTRAFDEHKALLGFATIGEARSAYYASFSDGSGPERLGEETAMSLQQFKAWLANGDMKKPFLYEEPTPPKLESREEPRRAEDTEKGEPAAAPARQITHADIPWKDLSRGERRMAEYLLERQARGTLSESARAQLEALAPTPPVDTAPAAEQAQEGGADVEPGLQAQPPDRPSGAGESALEGVPPGDVPGAGEVEPAERGAEPGGGPDEGGVPQRARPGGERRPRVGRGARAVGVSAGGEAEPGAPLQPGEGTEALAAVAEEADPGLGRKVREVAARASRGHDHRITEDALGAGGPKAKADANLEAIRTLKAIEGEGRQATAEEQAKLAAYVGWGAIPQLFTPNAPGYYDRQWAPLRETLEDLLSSDELAAARRSTINAHYTSVPVVRAMWQAVERLGVRPHDRILEPAMGTGNFFGLQPDSMLPAKRTGVELDSTSGRIAKLLYPNAAVVVKGLQVAGLPLDHYDLAISNVPFGNISVHDPAFRKHPEVLKSIHDYFFAKGLSLARPGGMVAFITSRYTMDKLDPSVRRYLGARADLVGAVRLPRTAFKANAGTEVVTDILFLRKLLPGEKPAGEAWMETPKLASGAAAGTEVNEYFHRHPEMVLGQHTKAGSMYRGDEYTVDGDLTPEILERAMNLLPEDAIRPYAEPVVEAAVVERQQAENADGVKDGAFTVRTGNLMVRKGEFYEPASLPKATAERVRGMVGVREAARKVLDLQLDGASDAVLAKAQKALGQAYDSFVKKHGALRDRANARAFDEDPDAPLLRALENRDPETGKSTKADIFTKRTVAQHKPVTKAENADAALAVVLNETGRLDWNRMEALTGRPRAALQGELGNLAFENPEGRTWETADAYLSGNVRQKLQQAQAAADADPRYERNVEALKAVQPVDLRPDEITARFGSPWIPATDMADFVRHILDAPNGSVKVGHSREMGMWALDVPYHLESSVLSTEKWGTARYPATDLIADGLNLRQPTVYDKTADDRRVVNETDTLAAREKLYDLTEELRSWLWSDPARAKRLGRSYNDEMNNLRKRHFDGSHLTLPGLSRVGLRGGDLDAHQKNAVWRAMQATPRTNVLFNHAPGAGKTLEFIAAIMERRRIGLTKKAAVAVPNHLLAQWGEAFRAHYPAAKVLVVEGKHVTPAGRQELMSKVATGNHDAVVMSFESMGKLPVRTDTFKRFMDEQIAELETAILGAEAQAGDRPGKGGARIVKELVKAKLRLEARLESYLARHTKDEAVTWEDLGIDFIAVDESQGFKRLEVPSKLQVAGIARGGSNRAMDAYMKFRHLNERGGVVAFGTGTPITNTLGEVFVLQKFLQPDLLKERGLEHFDSWAANFGEERTTYEYTATGQFKQKTRFARFVNVSDLSMMLAETMDTMLLDQLNLPVPKAEVIADAVEGSDALKGYVLALQKRAEAVRSKGVDPKEDNFLKITTDGRKAGTDMRLVGHEVDEPGSKLNHSVNNIFDIWKRTADRRATQIVFLDLSTPKARADAMDAVEVEDPAADEADSDGLDEDTPEEARENVSLYHDMREKLIRKGIPKEEIAFIHDVKTSADKERLNARMNSGQVRVLLGSTEKMATGLNVQRKLFALHLLTPPWRPDQIEQAKGRIVRQGNEHFDLKIPVELHYYATKNSYDAVMWQINENKNAFINAFMRAEPGLRSVEDTGQTVLNYAQMKAIATGDPRMLEKVALDGEVDKLLRLERAHRDQQQEQKYRMSSLKRSLEHAETQAVMYENEAKRYEAAKTEEFSITIKGKEYDDREEGGTALLEAVVGIKKPNKDTSEEVGSLYSFPVSIEFYETFNPNGKGGTIIVPTVHVGDHDANLSASPDGTVRSLEYTLRNLASQGQAQRGVVAREKREIGKLEEEAGKPFKDAEKLKASLDRQRALTAEMAADTKEEALAGGAGGGDEEPPEGGAGPAAPNADDAMGRLGRAAADARKRIRDRGKGVANDLGSAAAAGAGTMGDLGVIGADLIARGFRKFASWAKEMGRVVGDVVSGLPRFLRALWRDARAVFSGARGEKAPREAAAARPARAEPPKKAGGGVEQELRDIAGRATERARAIFDRFKAAQEKFRIAQEEADTVKRTGTIGKETREPFREAGQPSREKTRGFRFSEEDVRQSTAEMHEALKDFQRARQRFERDADPASAWAMRTAEKVMRDAVKAWQVYRSAAGRAVQSFNQPLPESMMDALRQAGVLADGARLVKQRVPIATNILESLKRWKDLTGVEKGQFGRDLLDHFRLNLFSVSSWTLDVIGNATELGGQLAGAGVADAIRVVKGDPTFPSLHGFLSAIRYRAAHRGEPLPPGIEKELGGSRTVSGEPISGGVGAQQGVFTYRKNAFSKFYDYLIGAPLYAKGAMDTAAKRLGATWQIFTEAYEAAAKKGLHGVDRQRFVDSFLEDLPEDTIHRATERARKAGFDRELTNLEEKMAGSTTAKLLVDTFMRWPFQFTRWAGEMLGVNPGLWRKFVKGEASVEEIGQYLGKAAVGIGGLMLLNQTLYDRTDFNSMEYVDDDGNRVRLSNRDPIPSALAFLALIRGDYDRAAAGLRFASVPFGRLLSGEGGLLGSTVSAFLRAAENPQNVPHALEEELVSVINRAIPGQAVLSSLKTLLDPKIREGVGANLPGVSNLLPAVVNPSTGEDLEPRQRVLGVELPSIAGVPIPGATRLMDPVQKLLSRYGLLVYRGPRQPVAGYPAGQMPDELEQEWQRAFGYYRTKLLGDIDLDALQALDPDRVRKFIAAKDALAAKYATREVSANAGVNTPKKLLPREPTLKERRGPVAWSPQ